MLFHLGNPQLPQYGFHLLDYPAHIVEEVNRLGPVKIAASCYDWPKWYDGIRGWTDTVNSLWWPQGADNFATCVLLIDDARNDLLNAAVSALRAMISVPSPGSLIPADFRFPWMILRASLSPPAYGKPGEAFPPGGVEPVDIETPLVEWKMYPLTPINLTSIDASNRFRGLWLLPIVDIRYYMRNTPLNRGQQYSSGSGGNVEYPLINIKCCATRDQQADWMPPMLAYPNDTFPPSNYVAISGNGTSTAITGTTMFGEAADIQAGIENWRVVCRDVRSKYNVPGGEGIPHDEFTGVISDYPENFDKDEELIEGYHIDACKFIEEYQSRIAGGLCDVRSLDEFIARKLQFIFDVDDDDVYYSLTIGSLTDFPVNVSQFGIDEDGPNEEERKIIPGVVIGKHTPSREPSIADKADLVTAAKQWSLLYHSWRRKQAYFKFPGIFPLIPNGHAKVIRWDFTFAQYETTYIALEGVQGPSQSHCCERKPFYARIDGEGSIDDSLHGYYAWTKLLDKDGNLIDYTNPRRGYVAGVNGQFVTVNPARDDTGKVAVPVGLVVWMKPGVPYLDVTTNKIFDHYRFTTGDLLQVVRLIPEERNKYGHPAAKIRRWNPDLIGFVDSSKIWAVLLE